MCHSVVMNGAVASLSRLLLCLCLVCELGICALLCYVQHDTRVCVFVVVFVCCVLCDVVIITAGGVGEATPAGGRVAKDGAEG